MQDPKKQRLAKKIEILIMYLDKGRLINFDDLLKVQIFLNIHFAKFYLLSNDFTRESLCDPVQFFYVNDQNCIGPMAILFCLIH